MGPEGFVLTSTRRTWLLASLGAVVSAASGITINVATDLKSSWLAWVGVVALAAATAGIAVAAELWRGRHVRLLENGPAANAAYLSMSNVRAASGGTVNQAININPLFLRTVLAISSVVWLTAAGGLAGGAILSRSNSDDPAIGAAPSVVAKTVDDFCSHWVTEKTQDEIESSLPIPDNLFGYGQWSEWSPVSDGIRATPGLVLLTVQGVNTTQVVLNDIRVRTVQKRDPVAGLELSKECGGEGAYRSLVANLDRDPPSVNGEEAGYSTPPEGEPEWSIKPVRFPYEVSATDAETFAIYAVTEDYDVDWVVEVDWVSAGESGTVVVDNGGKPFRTTSVRNAKQCTVLDSLDCA